MSRRGGCWDNAVAESFFSSLKRTHQEENMQNRDLAGGYLRLRGGLLQPNTAPQSPRRHVGRSRFERGTRREDGKHVYCCGQSNLNAPQRYQITLRA